MTAALRSTTTPPKRALRGWRSGARTTSSPARTAAPNAAALYSLIETAKLNGLDPEAYLRDVLARIADHPALQLSSLLPRNWAALHTTAQAA